MTPQERENPQILNASRKKRIAAGCGLQVVDVNRLLKQFEMMQQLTKQMTRGRLPRMGGGGMGGKISPSAVLVITKNSTRLVNVKNQDAITKILDMVPDLADKITGKGKKEEEYSAEDIEHILNQEEK